MAAMRLFLCGDVIPGRGIDQILPHPCDPALHESHVRSALGYVALAEAANGPIRRPVDPAYIWGAALDFDPESGALAALGVVPLQIRQFRLARASGDDAEWLRHTLDRESRKFGAAVVPGARGRLALSWQRS